MVGERQRLAATGRRQPDGYVVHAQRAYAGHDLLVPGVRSGRCRRNGRMGGEAPGHRYRYTGNGGADVDRDGDVYCDGNADCDGLRARQTGLESRGRRQRYRLALVAGLGRTARYELWTWWESVNDWQRLDDGNLTGTSYTHGGLTPGTTYWYLARAVDAAGATGAWAEKLPVTFTGTPAAEEPASTATATATPTVTATPTSDATQTATPTVTATPTPTATRAAPASALARPDLNAKAGDSAIDLRWSQVSGAARYELWTWWKNVNDWQRLDDGNLTGTSYTHSGLTPGTTYWYLARAVDAAGATGAWAEKLPVTFTGTPATEEPTSTATATPAITPTRAVVPTATTSEREALIALYEATGGANWSRSDNWLSEAPVGTWYGVSTDSRGRVTSLSLSHNEMSGSIPDLSALTNLQTLYLHSNQLTGSIPDLSPLSNLTDISLSYNQLSGPIPNLSALSNLQTLSLYNNRLTGSIPDLSALSNLQTLYLSSNQLSGTVPNLSALSNLTRISLSGNRLSGSIPDLSTLTNLTTLSLYNNQLSGTVPNLSALTNLQTLYLSSNQLTGQIPDLSALTNLQTLSLSRNQLTGPVPDLSALTNLQTLYLSHNQLTGPVPDLSALSNLQTLSLSRNQLTGPVPDLSALTDLTTLSLHGNSLCLPENFNLAGLNSDPAASLLGLFLPSCTGGSPLLPSSPPEERAALVALYKATGGANWTRNDNWLSDAPVATWYGVTIDGRGRVTKLYLESNGLSGPIPNLDDLTSQWYLDLGHNQLSGTVPDLSALSSLEILALGSNQLSGQFPDLSALSKLRKLYLYSNQLRGPIPDLNALSNLEYLSLSGNQLSGRIPDLSALTGLWYLQLSSNRLSGPIPDLSAHTSLRTLSLYNNQLSGTVPDLRALTNLRRLSLSDNQLTGSIPDLRALTNLRRLSLSGNQLTGSVPDLSALTNLTRLSLYNNQLSGSIPDLSALTNLTDLSLSGNRLCLPAGYNLAGANQVVIDRLNALNLAACTASDLPTVPDAPQNLTATVGAGQVTLRWDAVANAASYELWAYDSIKRAWARIGGALTGRSYTHPVLTDGRNYYFQVRARDADGVHGAWSERVFAAVVRQQFLPPPPSLGINTLLYQKYVDVDGMGVAAPSEVADEQLVHGRGIIRGMLSSRPDLLKELADNDTLIFIDVYRYRGIAFKSSWEAYVPERDPVPHCGTFIHELAHLIHFAIEDLPGGEAFNTRLLGLYQAARTAGRWRGLYASTNYVEYWAEAVRIWLHESMPSSLAPYHPTLADYDPEVAKLVEEVFGEATVPAACKP